LAPFLEQLAQRVATARSGIADAGIGPAALSSIPHADPSVLLNAVATQRAAPPITTPYDGHGGNGTAAGLQSEFQRRLSAMFAAAPGKLGVKSGRRSNAEQWALWNRSDKTGKYVARPGHSKHEEGIAADLAYSSPALVKWAHANARQFGLWFPMQYEDWHVEPIGSRG
jgi:hypothetical protein